MAGEAILKIREKEKEAAEIINDARDEALKIVLSAKEKKTDFLGEKDKQLEKEEEKIKEKYHREMEEILRELENEERKDIEKINTACKENLEKVSRFIADEIVKE